LWCAGIANVVVSDLGGTVLSDSLAEFAKLIADESEKRAAAP
jgi:hypothetical protein